MIFQDPMASLNESAKVDYIVSEGLYNFNNYKSEDERKTIVENALLKLDYYRNLQADFHMNFQVDKDRE